MRIKIILLIIACSIGINSFSQSEHYKLEISGDNRDIRNFNSNSIGVLIKTSVENDKIAFSMEITNNPDNQYKFYLFDEVASSKNSSNSIKSIWELKDWAEGIVKDELNKKDDAKINFDGNFINYNKQLLSRTLWSRSGYFGFKEITDANFDSYTLVANKVSELTDFSVAYIFMITDVKRSGEIVIGLTNPVIHIIPYNIVNELFKEFDKEVSIAVADQKVEDKVKDSDIGVEEKADLETEEKTSERIETKIEAGKVTKEEIKEDNVKKEVDKCSDLQNRFNNINSSIGRSDSGINWLDKLITDGIKEYRDQIGKCDNIDCFNEIKEKFDKEEWDKSLINTEDELNRQSRAVSALRQDKNFNACSINTSALISRINNLKQKRQSIEDEVEIIKVEIESKLIDQNAFNETVEKYKSEVSLIVDLYNQYNNLFNKYDDKFFNYRTLEKLEIKNLMDASIKIDSTKNKISDIITKAEILYREKTSQKDYFPEATFRKETGLSINTGDWENLKKEIDDLIKKAIESKPNNLFKIIIIGFIVLLLLIGGYAYFMGVVRGKIKNKLKNGSRQKNSKLSRVAEAGAIDSNSEPDGIEIIEDDNEINKGSGLDLVRKLAGIKYYEIDVQSFIQDTAVRKVYFCDDFVIKAYRYFEDKMLHFGNKSIDDLYE